MFRHELKKFRQGHPVDLLLLGRRFDLAMVKKLAVVRLPPAFWMQDPKINPDAEQLLQVALVLQDPERCRLALSVLAEEITEKPGHTTLRHQVERITGNLLRQCPETTALCLAPLVESLLQDLPD